MLIATFTFSIQKCVIVPEMNMMAAVQVNIILTNLEIVYLKLLLIIRTKKNVESSFGNFLKELE